MQGIDIIFAIAVLIMSVVIHEVSHGYVAYALGDPTAKMAGRLTLNPIRHLDPVGSILVPLVTSIFGFTFGWAKPVPYNPYNLRVGKWGPAYVAAAGPLSNLLVAIILGLTLRFGLVDGAAASFLTLIVFINILLAVFNLIPIPPLDGSGVLFALLPYRFQYIENFMRQNFLLLIVLLIFFGGNLLGLLSGLAFRFITGFPLF
ncbi:MAG: site-2 protease family protein [Candidatus Vogelbacteria bacterium CG10_big_fil_rev_8_21_14_0_10_51_16]|uniref:Site-2 protease family protein n=1 Tax=Candidatus Vogelbacteria bacterium CG10_big_fil_rev_8_21_14_0_10_51_16 TaxID=1975045 RepID=A0A2H0RF56_9BACT|nr:MAG: site-2 protease family protein [Candidatus Vogelbacteria bacterium CG10_big_fil_rev_8_21_14_0_10_51_16]